MKKLENDFTPIEKEPLNLPIDISDLDSEFREIGDSINHLTKAVEDFTNMYSSTVGSSSWKQQMPKNISKLGPASAALCKVHESFKDRVNFENEMKFLGERISVINKDN